MRHYNLSSANFFKVCIAYASEDSLVSYSNNVHLAFLFQHIQHSSKALCFLFIPVLGEGSMKGHEVICYLLI